MTIYLNIGPGKTGTTAVQSFLAHNRELLEQQGFAYPKFRNGNNHVPLTTGFCGWRNSRTKDIEPFFRHIKELESKKKVIISSEHLGIFLNKPFLEIETVDKGIIQRKRNIRRLREVFGSIDIIICSWLRRQDNMLDASYNQMVKGGLCYSDTIHEIKNLELLLDYDLMISSWVEEFDPSDIILREYDKKTLHEGNSISDFCLSLDIDIDRLVRTKVKKNHSYPCAVLEVRRLCNSYGKMSKNMISAFNLASLELSEKYEKEYSFLSIEHQKKLLKKYEMGNKSIVERFGGFAKRFAFYDCPDDIPNFRRQFPGITPDKIIEIMMAVQKKLEYVLQSK